MKKIYLAITSVVFLLGSLLTSTPAFAGGTPYCVEKHDVEVLKAFQLPDTYEGVVDHLGQRAIRQTRTNSDNKIWAYYSRCWTDKGYFMTVGHPTSPGSNLRIVYESTVCGVRSAKVRSC